MPPELIDFHSLFVQLQNRFPSSSLLTELVQVQATTVMVRAIVQIGEKPLATAMAAAPTVELAEDQARLRVLRLLGIAPDRIAGTSGMTTPYPMVPSVPGSRFEQREPVAPLADALISRASIAVPVVSDPPASPLPTISQPAPLLATFASPGESPSGAIAPGMTIPAIEPDESHHPTLDMAQASGDRPISPPAPTSPKVKRGAIAESESIPPSEPMPSVDSVPDFPEESAELSDMASGDMTSGGAIDLSELIALIGVEIERVGWDTKQGQVHLKQTYGKRSRSQLSEDELMDFLHFLRALPSK